MCVYIGAKLDVSSIILTCFKTPTAKQTTKKPILIKVKMVFFNFSEIFWNVFLFYF